MTPEQIEAARAELGLTMRQLGRLLGYRGSSRTLRETVEAILDGRKVLPLDRQVVLRSFLDLHREQRRPVVSSAFGNWMLG
jgi:hypothetical protein